MIFSMKVFMEVLKGICISQAVFYFIEKCMSKHSFKNNTFKDWSIACAKDFITWKRDLVM